MRFFQLLQSLFSLNNLCQCIYICSQIRTCLFSRTETDLRTPLRAGASDRELAELWAGAQGRKAAAHGIGEPGFVQPTRTMSAIGG